MSTSDVRVKLSAEGIDDIVQAFKRIQDETKKTGKEVDKTSKSFADFKKILGGIGVVAAVKGLAGMVTQSIDLADSMGKLNQKTGMTVETLSTLSYASRSASLSQEQLDTAMINFAKTMAGYDKHAHAVREATQNLFGDRNALQGLDQDKRFRKITDALAKLEPGARRTGLALQFFGKSGAELLPLIDSLGAGGFDELRAKAEKLGLVMSGDLVARAQEFNNRMAELKAQAEAAALQFSTGLMPAISGITNALSKISGEAQGAGGAMEWFGKITGYVFKGLMTVIYAASAQLSGFIALFMGLNKVINGLVTRGFKGATDEFTNLKNTMSALVSQYKEQFKELWAEQEPPKLKPPTIETDDTESHDPVDLDAAQKDADRLAKLKQKADEDYRKAKLDREASLQSAITKFQEQETKEQFDQGLISLREYYAKRRELAEKQGKAEAVALLRELERLQSEHKNLVDNGEGESPEAIQAQAAIEKAASAYHAQLIKNSMERRALDAEEARETEALNQKALEFEKYLARLQMDRFEQARESIAEEARQYDELLTKMNVAPSERAGLVAGYIKGASQQVEFAEIEQKAQDAFDEIARARRKIELEVEAGLIFAFQGEQQIMELERERLPILQQIADSMAAAAINPEQIRAAEDFQERINELAVASDSAAKEMAKFKQNIEGALTNDLSNWFASGIQGAESMGDAFRGLALSVVQSLQQMAAQMLATLAIQNMLKAAGGIGFSGGGQVPVTKASGGMIHGPGTGTSDSIPAWLSNGEYVVRASAVAIPGVKELLDDINYGMRPLSVRRPRTRFAAGGYVDVPSAAESGKIAGLGATIELDRGLLLKEFKADPEFARLIVGTIGNNKKGVKGALS